MAPMLDSGSAVQLDGARFTAGSQALGGHVADLAARRCEVGDSVDALLRGWRGEAADTFRRQWEAWRDGADVVIDGLRRDVAALALAQVDLRRVDTHSSAASSGLQRRLG